MHNHFVKFFAKFGGAAFVAEKFLVPKVLVPRMTVLYTTTLCGGLVGGYYHCIPGSGGCKGHFKDRSNERKKFFSKNLSLKELVPFDRDLTVDWVLF